MRIIPIPAHAPIGQDNTGREVWPSPEYKRLFGLQIGRPSAEEPQTVAAGPSAFSKRNNRDGFYIVEGGTVTAIEYQRGENPVTSYDLGGTAGQFFVFSGDVFQVTYTSAPTITFFPA